MWNAKVKNIILEIPPLLLEYFLLKSVIQLFNFQDRLIIGYFQAQMNNQFLVLQNQGSPQFHPCQLHIKNRSISPLLKTIIIYNMFGHMLFTRPHEKETEPVLDLTYQAQDMHYIKIIQGQQAEVVKVVAE